MRLVEYRTRIIHLLEKSVGRMNARYLCMFDDRTVEQDGFGVLK